MSALYIVGGWMFGLAWIGLLSALSEADQLWVAHLSRAIFAAGTTIILVASVVIVAASNKAMEPSSGPSRSGVWTYVLGCAIPVTLLGLFTMRRNTARPLITAVATLPAVAFLLAAGAAFRPTGAQVNGLAATVHHHHLLVGAALAVVIALPATTLWLPKR